jgi:hypothetical protein
MTAISDWPGGEVFLINRRRLTSNISPIEMSGLFGAAIGQVPIIGEIELQNPDKEIGKCF